MTATATAMPRLKAKYRETIVPALQEEFQYSNVMQIPGLVKIVVNMGVGEAARDSKIIEGAIRDLTAITGQKPAVTKARKSIAQFKLREGQPIGCHVTLRGDRMWEFADRLLRGMDITFVTSATNDVEGRALLKHLGFPFKAVDDPKKQSAKRGPAYYAKKKK